MPGLFFNARYYNQNPNLDSSKKFGGYARYMATREGVEIIPKKGMHGSVDDIKGSSGMFSDYGSKIALSNIRKEIDDYRGNIWGIILGMDRQDAERLGYNTADRWRTLICAHRNDIAKEMHIRFSNLKWYAAFHNHEDHPHVHLIVWSKDLYEAYLSKKGILNIKKTIEDDIFKQDLISVYKRNNENTFSDEDKEKIRKNMRNIAYMLQNNPDIISDDLYDKMSELGQKLSIYDGKRVYGYIKIDARKTVNSIFEIMPENKEISDLYDLWYESKCKISGTYTDVITNKVLLYENEKFKSLKNAIINVADNLGSLPDVLNFENEYDYDYLLDIKDDKEKLLALAENGDSTAMYRLGKYYLSNEFSSNEAKLWLEESSKNDNHFAMVQLYMSWINGQINITKDEAINQLRNAVDKNIPFAEYEYYLFLRENSKSSADEYLKRAYNHGDVRAMYLISKELFLKGKTEEAIRILKEASKSSNFCKAALALMYIYKLNNLEKGMEKLQELENDDCAIAKSLIRAIKENKNALTIFGLYSLFNNLANMICSDVNSSIIKCKPRHAIDRREINGMIDNIDGHNAKYKIEI